MASLKEHAQDYVPPRAKNIASIEKIPVNLEVKSDKAKKKDGTDFTYLFVELHGEKYRVPGAVLGGIKSVLKKYPDTKFVTIDKQGEGMNTTYSVMPWVPTREEDIRDVI